MNGLPTNSRPIEVRFWEKVAKREPEECWPWTGARVESGHGVISRRLPDGRHRNEGAHRLAWEIANGQAVPAGMHVRHSCDNPPCCNPAHLQTGTTQDNTADRVMRGRGARGSKCHHQTPFRGNYRLTAEQVVEIRRRRAEGELLRVLGLEFGVTAAAISLIANRKQWRHVP